MQSPSKTINTRLQGFTPRLRLVPSVFSLIMNFHHFMSLPLYSIREETIEKCGRIPKYTSLPSQPNIILMMIDFMTRILLTPFIYLCILHLVQSVCSHRYTDRNMNQVCSHIGSFEGRYQVFYIRQILHKRDRKNVTTQLWTSRLHGCLFHVIK